MGHDPAIIVNRSNFERYGSREEVPAKYRWNLDDVFPDSDRFEQAFRDVQAQINELAGLKGSLAASGEALLAALRLRDGTSAQLEKLALYAGLSYHEDMSRSEAQARWDRVQNLSTRAAEATSWMTPEILALPAATLKSWLEQSADLRVYAHALDDIQRQREHVLSPREEELLAMAGEMAAAPENIYSRFTNTNLDFPTIKDESGADVKLSMARYSAFLYSRQRRVRRDAFLGLHETYAAKANTLSALLSAQVKQHIFYARARRYPSCLAAALDGPNIPVAVYENLIATIGRHVDKLHRYVGLRKKLMRLEEVHAYDLYVPLVDAPEEKIPYDEAIETVLRGLAPLGADYVATMRRAAESRWIDVYETPNKRSGAYSWGTYLTHPYLLLNYNGTMHDRSTIAHEMGHAMHSWYTTKNQPMVYGSYATFCAEVASTVNEVLLADHLLKTARNDVERLLILQQEIDGIRTTVFRQTLFAEYEKLIHARAEAGEALTGEFLGEAYAELVRKYYGPDLVIDECLKAEALRIPHFFREFYVYTYATSHCAAMSIGRRILAGDGAAVEGHLEFLSAGCSRYPIDILRLAGVDMTTPAAIEETMGVFDRLLDEFDELYRRAAVG